MFIAVGAVEWLDMARIVQQYGDDPHLHAAYLGMASDWTGMGDWRLMFIHRDRLRAVNTVVPRDGRLVGANTDVAGALWALGSQLGLRDARWQGSGPALLLGTDLVKPERDLLLAEGRRQPIVSADARSSSLASV